MIKTSTTAALTVLLAGVLACGKSSDQKKAEEATKAIEQASKQMEEAGKKMEQDAAKGAAEMAKGLEGLAKGFGALAGGTASVEPVSFRELQTVFPEFSGWDMEKPTGEKMTAPVSFSKASVVYRKGDARIEATLVDSGFNQLLLLPYAWIQNMGYEKETEHGYEKSVKVAGHPGFEKWDSAGKDAEVNAFVSKRFILQLEGSNLEDTKVLHQLAEAANLGKLAGLK